jgi:RNA polymerase sigma-70 factor (ECF subfamily)
MSVMRLTFRAGVAAKAATVTMEEATARARSGDHEAFRLIFERYCKPVTGFIFDMVNDRGLAEELAQETFVRAYRGLPSMREETRLSTWLFGIAKNVAYEQLRSRRRRPTVGIEEVAEVAVGDKGPSPDDDLLNKELGDVIQKALAGLDEDKRLVFTLKVFQQKSYEEIATITGFSIAKLKTDLHRARAEMRRRVGPYVEGVQ